MTGGRGNGRAFAHQYGAGALMVLVGLAVVFEARTFGLGTLARVGAGLYPMIVGAALTVVGGLIALTPEAEGAVVVPSLDDALLESQFVDGGDTVWILGGGEIFRQSTELANVAVVTTIDVEADGDTYAPELGTSWEASSSLPPDGWLTGANGTRYRFTKWSRTES